MSLPDSASAPRRGHMARSLVITAPIVAGTSRAPHLNSSDSPNAREMSGNSFMRAEAHAFIKRSAISSLGLIKAWSSLRETDNAGPGTVGSRAYTH